jgi:rfaE bifunctional protein kinase chain/domain
MDQIGQQQLAERLAIRKPTILVCGDFMLDRYRIADAVRISPEAPVPVLINPRTEDRLGGAGAVAAMCAALGASVGAVGVIGPGRDGEIIHEMLIDAGVSPLLVGDPDRQTTVKERICGVASGRHRQQLARLDRETTTPLGKQLSRDLAGVITGNAADPIKWDAIIVSDYGKGACTDVVVRAAIQTGSAVFVDPPKGRDWGAYYRVSCLVPNREEAGSQSATDIMRQYGTQAAIVKLDAEGCRLAYRVEPDGKSHPPPIRRSIPARARAVHDITACGDEFIAMLAVCRAVGLDWITSATLANAAAGLQAERHGATPITLAELQEVDQCLSVQ